MLARYKSLVRRQFWQTFHARSYNFASTDFDKCFKREGIPDYDTTALRVESLSYLDSFDAKTWYEDPIVTILKGNSLKSGEKIHTVDAFNRENGNSIMATSGEVDAVIEHMLTYVPPKIDYRNEVRSVEAEIFANHAGFLVGNQAMDYLKQDGLTEIEESAQANIVEQRLGDQLLEHEFSGAININRSAAYIGCVSNFSNFLDLFRKVLRNVELGVPVVVLSRENTGQHMFRWFQMLVSLFEKHNIDQGMITFISADLSEKSRMFSVASSKSPMYFTCSRTVASRIKSIHFFFLKYFSKIHGPVMASTGGPNTLVSTSLTPEVSDAIRMSATIENSGQCTALRHAVVPCTLDEAHSIFDGCVTLSSPNEALKKGEFAAIYDFASDVMKLEKGYKTHLENSNVALKHSKNLPGYGIEEHWRNVYADVTSPTENIKSGKFISKLSRWLVENQPITLAINDEENNYTLSKQLFEQTGQVVYTVGTIHNPALTCQARPQDSEIFGEFPVRRDLSQFTKYPVIVPSSTPSYNSTYNKKWLSKMGGSGPSGLFEWKANVAQSAIHLIESVKSQETKGFMRVVHEYLSDALFENPKLGRGVRTTLYGLQTTPLNGQLNFIRCDEKMSFDDLAPYVWPFFLTSALPLLKVSLSPSNQKIADVLKTHGVNTIIESAESFTVTANDAFNITYPELFTRRKEWPLAGQFISLYFCCGHIKSTHDTKGGNAPDKKFIDAFVSSKKWLSMRTLSV